MQIASFTLAWLEQLDAEQPVEQSSALPCLDLRLLVESLEQIIVVSDMCSDDDSALLCLFRGRLRNLSRCPSLS